MLYCTGDQNLKVQRQLQKVVILYNTFSEKLADIDVTKVELMVVPGGNIKEIDNTLVYVYMRNVVANQRPRCKQRGIKLVAMQSSRVFDPRGSRQISAQVRLLGSLLAGIKESSLAVQKKNYAVHMYKNVGFEIVNENEEEYIMICRL